MRKEQAREGVNRPARVVAMLKAIEQLRTLRPPCANHQNETASHVITDASGNLRAVCAMCAAAERLDRRIAAQREEVAAMRRRRG
jgi:hypothetical protein